MNQESALAAKEKREGWTKENATLYTPVGGGMEYHNRKLGEGQNLGRKEKRSGDASRDTGNTE